MEKLAAEVAAKFATVCVKLRQLKPEIEKIRSYFQESIRSSVTLAGCRSFREFCENRLYRSQQAVYKMLSSATKEHTEKKKVVKATTAHQKPGIAREDIEQLRSACFAAARHFDAEANGNQAAAEKAKEEFLAISKAKPWIFGDVPNYRLMLLELLAEIGKQNEELPMPTPLMCMAAAMRKRLGIDEQSFGIPPEQEALPSAAAEHLGRPMAGRPGAAQTREATLVQPEAEMADGKRRPNQRAEAAPRTSPQSLSRE